MAQVRDIRLMLGMNAEFQQMAEVTFAVEFSQAEVNQNINFGMYVSLLQYDERIMAQFKNSSPNGAYEYGMHNYQNGRSHNPTMGRENGVLWIAREVIRPNGTKTHYFTRKCSFQRPNSNNNLMGNFNNQDFTANVNIIPEITEGRAWSNVVRMGQNSNNYQNGSNGHQNGNYNQEPLYAFADNVI